MTSSSTLSKTFFSYIPKKSLMNKLHPLTKILLMLVLSIISFLLSSLLDLLILLVFNLLLIIITRVPVFSKKFLKIIIGFTIANLSIFVAWCLFSQRPGDITFFETQIVLIKDVWVWNILITDQTLINASRIFLRALAMFFLVLFFFAGTSDRDLINGLRSVKIPFAASLMINITFRGLSMFMTDYQTVKEALQTRGVDFKNVSIIQKIRYHVSIFIALIVLMFKRTENMSNSIEARGIPVRSKNRTIYHYFPLKWWDIMIIILLLGFLFFSIYLNITDIGLLDFLLTIVGGL